MSRFHSLLPLAGLLTLLALPAAAQTPPGLQLDNPTTQDVTNFDLGHSVALSERFVLLGEPGHAMNSQITGAAHVYDTRSGKHLRRLRPSGLAHLDRFGASVAVCGSLGLVGAPGDDEKAGNSGAVYVFDLATGRMLRKLTPPSFVAGGEFGASVALSENIALVGAPYDDALNVGDRVGTAHAMDVLSGIRLRLLKPSNPTPFSLYGASVALDGTFAVVGAPNETSSATGAGAVYVHNMKTGNRLRRIAPQGLSMDDHFGFAVAISQNRILVGAPDRDGAAADEGAAYLFDRLTGDFVAQLAPGGQTNVGRRFGHSVALAQALAVVGAPGCDVNGVTAAGTTHAFHLADATEMIRLRPANYGNGNYGVGRAVAAAGLRVLTGRGYHRSNASINQPHAGAANLFTLLEAPRMDAVVLARSEANAPNTSGGQFARFETFVLNPGGETAFRSSLTGKMNAGLGRQALWSTHFQPNSVFLRLHQGKNLIPNAAAGRPAGILFNHSQHLLFEVPMTGAAVESGSRWLMGDNGAVQTVILRHGENSNVLPAGQRIKQMRQVVQCGAINQLGVNYSLRTSFGGVNRGNDSGILILGHTGSLLDAGAREGALLPQSAGGGSYGQFMPRIAQSRSSNHYLFPASQILPDGARQALFLKRPGQSPERLAFNGMAVPNDFVSIRTLLGETVTANQHYFRTSLAGATRTNNEAIWQNGVVLLKKGVAQLPQGLFVRRFLRFWPAGDNQLLIQARLGGPGVTNANDAALVLREASGAWRIVCREGDLAAGAEGGRIGAFQRVDAHPTAGVYAILASLRGAAGANQGLLLGRALMDGSDGGTRSPFLMRRKGAVLASPFSSNDRIRGITLPNRVDQTGFGGKGLSCGISNVGEFGCIFTLNGGRQIMVKSSL